MQLLTLILTQYFSLYKDSWRDTREKKNAKKCAATEWQKKNSHYAQIFNCRRV